jgi:hypothetical protein
MYTILFSPQNIPLSGKKRWNIFDFLTYNDSKGEACFAGHGLASQAMVFLRKTSIKMQNPILSCKHDES